MPIYWTHDEAHDEYGFLWREPSADASLPVISDRDEHPPAALDQPRVGIGRATADLLAVTVAAVWQCATGSAGPLGERK